MNMGTELTKILVEIEKHHVRLNSIKGRDESKSHTLELVRQAIDLSKQPPVYAMSRDYEALYDHLVKAGEALGFVDEKTFETFQNRRRVPVELIRLDNENGLRLCWLINGMPWKGYSESPDAFKAECARINLEWLAPSPQAVTVEGLSPVWSPAEDELDTPCWVTGCKCAIGPICKPDLYCARCGTPIDHSRVDVDIAPASPNTLTTDEHRTPPSRHPSPALGLLDLGRMEGH